MSRYTGGLAPRQALAALLLCLAVVLARAQPHSPEIELSRAQRVAAGVSETVRLPDFLESASPAAPAVRATYRLQFPLAAAPPPLALYLPGLVAHARVRVNGHVVDDTLGDPMGPLPRSLHRVRLIDLPPEFLRTGVNALEIEAAAPAAMSLSTVWLGEQGDLRARYEGYLVAAVLGPAVVAVAIGTVGVSMLLLWLRRHEAVYGYFGVGALSWALYTSWSVLPASPLSDLHHAVWGTALYGFFVSMLAIFCLKFARWHWPGVDRVLWAAALAAPLLLYAAYGLGRLDAALEAWRLAWIGVVAIGLIAGARRAWSRWNVESALLLVSAAAALGLGLRDWLVEHGGNDNNPVLLVPYAGLPFIALMAWMLIDRFVAAGRGLEQANSELEDRVAGKAAELARALEQMRHARDAAEAANRAKSSFLAAASHDLRQPIHALGLYLAALRSAPVDGGQLELLERMGGSLAAMDTMFNSLLDISRIDSGALVPRAGAFEIGPLLHRLGQEFAPMAAEKELRLSVRVAPAARRLRARGDPVLVDRIVRNLLANAVKFTTSGGVLLSCRLRGGVGRVGGAAHWALEVWDTGAGIDAAEHERVFDEYYQVGNPERDRAGGLGLGLSIVRRLTALLSLRLTLHSRVGRGSRFVLDLPVTADEAPHEREARSSGSVEQLGVAVVDDDPEVRDGMQALLSRWGCRAFAGADVGEVLQRAGAAPWPGIDVIVADYRLREGVNGVEAIQALRTACGRDVPALIVSGDSAPERLAQIQASGFEALSKPVPAARLQRWLALAARPRTVPQARAALMAEIVDEAMR